MCHKGLAQGQIRYNSRRKKSHPHSGYRSPTSWQVASICRADKMVVYFGRAQSWLIVLNRWLFCFLLKVRTLFVSGLPLDIKPRELYLLFRPFKVHSLLFVYLCGHAGYEEPVWLFILWFLLLLQLALCHSRVWLFLLGRQTQIQKMFQYLGYFFKKKLWHNISWYLIWDQ